MHVRIPSLVAIAGLVMLAALPVQRERLEAPAMERLEAPALPGGDAEHALPGSLISDDRQVARRGGEEAGLRWIQHPGRLGSLPGAIAVAEAARELDAGDCGGALRRHVLSTPLPDAGHPASEALLALQLLAASCEGRERSLAVQLARTLSERRPDLQDWPPVQRFHPSGERSERGAGAASSPSASGSPAGIQGERGADAAPVLSIASVSVESALREARLQTLQRLRRQDRDAQALALSLHLLELGAPKVRVSALEACATLAPRLGDPALAMRCLDCALESLVPAGVHWCDPSLSPLAGRLPPAEEEAAELEAMINASAVEIAVALLAAGATAEASALLRLPKLDQLSAHTPFLQARLAFWRGRSALAAGATWEARAALRSARKAAPLSWYALRADELLRDLGEPPLQERWIRALLLSERGFAHTDASAGPLLLWGAGLPSHGLQLAMRRLQGGERCMHLAALAVVLLHERGDMVRAQEVGHRFLRLTNRSLAELETLDGAVLRAMYPLAWLDGLAEAGVDPEEWSMVLALMQRESGFRAEARSHVGALGLMQVMPRTGRGVVGHTAAGTPLTARALLEPVESIRVGAAVHAAYRARFASSRARALAAYSTGPGRVAGWNMPGDDDMWVELIPYPVVRHYVRGVSAAEAVYAARLHPAGQGKGAHRPR